MDVENVSPTKLNKITDTTSDLKVVTPSGKGGTLKLKRSKLVEVGGTEAQARPYSPELYTTAPAAGAVKEEEEEEEGGGLVLKKSLGGGGFGGGGRYGGVVEDVEDEDVDGDDDGIMPTEVGGTLHRSASEGGTSLVFRSPNGTKKGETKEFPAGSGIDIVKTKRNVGANVSLGLEEDGDLYAFFKSIRIKDVVAREYSKVLMESGYDDVESLGDATEVDLELCGIKPGHAKRMKRASEIGNAPMVEAADFSKTTSQINRGKSASEVRSTLEEDLAKASALKKRGRAQSAVGAARKELTLKYDPAASVQDMDYAKIKLQAQAKKIRELEARLAEKSMDQSKVTSKVKEDLEAKKQEKRLSASERLKAHKDRKQEEEKKKEKGGEWKKPTKKPEGKSLVEKVKTNEALTDRLTSKNAGERREREKEVKKTLKKAAAVVAPPNDGAESPAIGGKMRSEAGKKVAVSLDGRGSKGGLTAEEKREKLMKR